MSRRKLPYMRLYLSDYFDDTSHLSVKEHGAYLLILMRYTQTQDQPREDRIHSVIGMPKAEWLEIRDEVASFFEVINGRWKHKRIDDEINRFHVNDERRKKGGRKATRTRRRAAKESGTPFRPRNSRAKNTPGLAEWRELRAAVFERDGYVCTYCGVDTDAPHCDHIMPVSRGGSSALDNLTTACAHCNLSKGCKTLDEWRAEQ